MTATTDTPALEAMRRSVAEALRPQRVAQVIERQLLKAHYQPIVRLKDGVVVGHEIRGPVDTPFHTPDALFAAARTEGLPVALEQACLLQGLRGWNNGGQNRRLFVNLSADVVVQLLDRLTLSGVAEALAASQVAPAAVVVEITEHERVADIGRLSSAADALRAIGIRFALDDFGDGRSSLRLWAELHPEFVKIDKYFVRGVDGQAVKVQTLRGLTRLAETFGTTLVAEGIETAAELRIVRDLGIALGQGYFLGRPQVPLAEEALAAAVSVIESSTIAVLPEMTRAAGAQFTARRLALPVPPLRPGASNDEVARLFDADGGLRAIALVDGDRPVGLLNRQAFTDRYAKPFFREIYGRKSCLLFANTTPLLLDQHTGIDGLTAVLTAADQRYLSDGFIVTEGGRYFGLGTGEQLVRVVTEVRIEAARHANPLTFLPGNIPITEHIDRLLGSRSEFVACYGDLNDFKPFNDHYGYWRGDEMIRLLARTLTAQIDPCRDFIGHVGGDDFVVLFQSSDWLQRCQRSTELFNEAARTLFDDAALARGGIDAEDRHGVRRFFGFTTLSIGAVPVRPGSFTRPEDVASAAAAAKHLAKSSSRGLSVQAH